MMRKQPTPPLVLGAILLAHATLATLTWRDLRERPDEQVRGPKTFWRVASVLNTLGSVAYWTVGRRRSTAQPSAGL